MSAEPVALIPQCVECRRVWLPTDKHHWRAYPIASLSDARRSAPRDRALSANRPNARHVDDG